MKAFTSVLSALFACSQAQYLASPYSYAAGLTPHAYNYAPYAAGYAAPYAYNAAPYAYAAPVAVAPVQTPSSQFHAQDEFGNLNYGYANINSQKFEVGNAYGGVSGGYSYVDANGEIQKVQYVADALGFRVTGTNLPVAPEVPAVEPLEAPVYTGVAPTAPDDTAEVKAAKAEFFEAFEKEANREKRDADIVAAAPFAYSAYPYAAGYAHGYPYAAGYAHGYPYAAGYAHGYYPYAAATALLAKDEKTPAATTKAEFATIAAPASVTYAHAPLAYAAPHAPKAFGYSTYSAAPAYGYAGFPYAAAYATPAAISA